MIHVRCHTNLDAFSREEWPTFFVVPPRVGDFVESKSGRTLKIITIYHKYFEWKSVTEGGELPYLLVELHKVA